MASQNLDYNPDYAVPPGWVLAERLGAYSISHAEFARRCGRSPKLISEIISGKAPVEPKTALEFERVLGVDAGIWLGIEANYRLHLAREAELRKAEESAEWAKGFPIAELRRRGLISPTGGDSERVSALLSFFGVGSVEAWNARQERLAVAFRHSPSFSSDEKALATWLRIGEFEAEQRECQEYNQAQFRRALVEIRALTATPFNSALRRAQQLCLESGVVLAVIKPLPKTALSGATRWMTPRKALIQLSARHKTDDQLWLSFFHEAAHVLLDSKKDIFVHDSNGKVTPADQRANEWAANFLVPGSAWESFVRSGLLSEARVRAFAREQAIAPGIVVGRLQHENKLPWKSRLARLKKKLMWSSDAG